MGNGSGYCLCALLISNDGLLVSTADYCLVRASCKQENVPCVELSTHKRVERMEGKSFRRRRQVASRFGLLSIASLAIAFGMRS